MKAMEDQGLITARESSLQVCILLLTPRKVLGRLQVFLGDCWGGSCAPEAEGLQGYPVDTSGRPCQHPSPMYALSLALCLILELMRQSQT